MQPGVADPTAYELVLAALDMGPSDDWRPALAAIAAARAAEDGDRSDHERGIAAIDAAAAEAHSCDPLGRMLVAEHRWWMHLPDADADDRMLARDLRVAAEAVGGMWMLEALGGTITASLRHGDRDDFDAVFGEFAAFAARTGLGQADVAVIETSVALLDGRFADAERLAFALLATLDPESSQASMSGTQIAAAWDWSGRDEDLLNALDGFAADRRSQRTLIELAGIAARARRGERDPRWDRFAADEFESLPWDWFRHASLARASTAAAALRDMRSAVVLEAILEPYHEQLLLLPWSIVVFDAADGAAGACCRCSTATTRPSPASTRPRPCASERDSCLTRFGRHISWPRRSCPETATEIATELACWLPTRWHAPPSSGCRTRRSRLRLCSTSSDGGWLERHPATLCVTARRRRTPCKAEHSEAGDDEGEAEACDEARFPTGQRQGVAGRFD